MVGDRQIQETVARCVSTMVFYHNSERSRHAVELMIAEVRLIAGLVKGLGVELVEVDARIFRPVEAELIVRYGHEVGPRMLGQFIAAFEGACSIDA